MVRLNLLGLGPINGFLITQHTLAPGTSGILLPHYHSGISALAFTAVTTNISQYGRRRPQFEEIMASRFDEQPAAGMGRREEGARRAQAYRTDDEGAPRRTKYTGDSRDARSSRRYQKSAARGMDVLWALSWTNWDH